MITTNSNDIKERLSVGVVTLVAARAGCRVMGNDVDRDSIDVTIRPVQGEPVCIDAQLKGSSSLSREEDHLIFDLPINNYNDLRSEIVGNARILIVLDLHNDDENWLEVGNDFLRSQNRAYWVDLYGQPFSTNTTRKRIRIPLNQPFTPDSLRDIMQRRFDNIVAGLGGVS